MLPLGVLLVLALASYRVARIFTEDTISEPWRLRLYLWAYEIKRGAKEPVARGPVRTYVYEGLTCPLCLGVWIAGVHYLLWRWGGDVLRGLLVVLAVAGLQCWLQMRESDSK